MSATIACVRGCTVVHRHVTDCDPAECRGCEPREARHGLLCSPCHERLRMMLTDAPTVEAWLTANLGGSGSNAAKEDWERSKGGDGEAPAPLSVGIFDIRQLLGDQLHSWVECLCDAVRDMNNAPLRGPAEGQHDAAYLLHWLATIERKDWVADLWDELAETTSQAHALAPWRPALKRHSGVPCPECEATQLATFGGEDEVSCLSCRYIMSPQAFNLWAQIQRDKAQLTA